MTAWVALGLLVVAGLVLVLSHDSGTIAGFDNSDFAGIVAGLALLIFLGGAVFRGYRGRFTKGLRDAVVWAGMAFVLNDLRTQAFLDISIEFEATTTRPR